MIYIVHTDTTRGFGGMLVTTTKQGITWSVFNDIYYTLDVLEEEITSGKITPCVLMDGDFKNSPINRLSEHKRIYKDYKLTHRAHNPSDLRVRYPELFL